MRMKGRGKEMKAERGSKTEDLRRKQEPVVESDEEDEEVEEAGEEGGESDDDEDDRGTESASEEDGDEPMEASDDEEEQSSRKKPSDGTTVKGPINMKKLVNFKDKLEKTGVVYLSRVPPYMKAQKVRHLLSKYGEIGRIYLTPEDPAIQKKRKAMGGNKKQSFVDGWIEFADKRVAKQVAKSLNATPIGGKATSFWSSDLWNLKYLSKFKWNHLTEKVAYDNQVRKQKLLAEIAQAKRERDFYLDKAEQNKHRERIRKKQKTHEGQTETEVQVARTFKQRQALGVGAHKGAESDQGVPGDKSGQSAQMRSVLGMVFGK